MSEKLKEALAMLESEARGDERYGYPYENPSVLLSEARKSVESLFQSLRETALTASESRHATVRIKTANGDAYDCPICSRIFAKLRRISATPDTREESEKERGK